MPGSRLRARLGLFFVALAAGAMAVLALGLWLGFSRGGGANGFVTSGIVAGFGIVGLTTAVWYLFDKNVARPIERLAVDLRARAHSDVTASLDHGPARYLGDLGPAAQALSARIGDKTLMAAEHMASETARLTADHHRLTAVLSDIPYAVIMVSEDHRIMLYDGQSAHALEPIRPLCLGQSIFGYLDETQIRRALQGAGDRATVALNLATADGTRVFDATLRQLGRSAGYMLTLQCEPDAHMERPLVFDFQAMTRPAAAALRAAPLEDLTYVIFDTETTGLLPDKDEVVQFGAVRAVGPRLVNGETFDTLVNPGRPIPRTSTEVHGITDAMVAGAPTMDLACRRFLQYAEDSVLVAHNAPFDMAFLRRQAGKEGLELTHPVLDTVLLAAELFGATDSLTLDAIATRLGVAIPDEARHTALGDAKATAAVFLKLVKIFQARGVETLGGLLDIQKNQTHILPDLNQR